MATAFRWQEIPRGEDLLKEPRVIRGQGRAPQQLRPVPVPVSVRTLLRNRRGLAPRRNSFVEFHTVKRIDNSRLVRHVEPVRLRSYYKIAALGGMVAMCFMLYIYQHFRCIDLSFQLEDLKAKQTQAQALNGQLKLEIESWRNPRRINAIARQLGLQQAMPTQVLEYSGFDGGQVEAARLVKGNHAP
jgi:cell division protein FtsL